MQIQRKGIVAYNGYCSAAMIRECRQEGRNNDKLVLQNCAKVQSAFLVRVDTLFSFHYWLQPWLLPPRLHEKLLFSCDWESFTLHFTDMQTENAFVSPDLPCKHGYT